MDEVVDLLGKPAGGCAGLLGHSGVELRHSFHGADGVIDLAEALCLAVARKCQLADIVGNFANSDSDIVQGVASLLDKFHPCVHLARRMMNKRSDFFRGQIGTLGKFSDLRGLSRSREPQSS